MAGREFVHVCVDDVTRCSYVKPSPRFAATARFSEGRRGLMDLSLSDSSRSRQTRRARWRLRQRSAPILDLPSACFLAQEVPGGWVRLSLADRDAVKGAVELAVAAAIESVASAVSRGGGDRGDAGEAGELGVGAEAPRPGGLGDLLGAGSRRPTRGRSGPWSLLGASETAAEAIEPDDPIEATGRELQLGPEVVQVPAQAALVLGAGPDEILAVVEQELDPQGALVEVGGRQGLGTLLQRGPGDRPGVDRVGLAGAAFAPAALPGQLRGHPDDPLSGSDQEALQGTGDVVAVLDRPDPLVVEAPPPGEQPTKARLPGLDGELAGEPAGSCRYCGTGVGSFVGVRADPIILASPFDWSLPSDGPPADEPHSGRLPRSYQVKPRILGWRRATQRVEVRPSSRHQA
jgi:hypothetical protein